MPPTMPDEPTDSLAELRFLHRVLRLATTARSWDELLEHRRRRDARRAPRRHHVALPARSRRRQADAGRDERPRQHQIGRATVPFGEGMTGRVAQSRDADDRPDVRADPRFLWVRGIDQRRFVASMLSVPLIWHDQVVGVLNVQTEQPRDFDARRRDQLRAIADLLGGHRREGPPAAGGRGAGRAAAALDRGPGRAHRARDPRAADAAGGRPRLRGPPRRRAAARRSRVARPGPARAARGAWHEAASSRSSGSTGSSTRSSPRSGVGGRPGGDARDRSTSAIIAERAPGAPAAPASPHADLEVQRTRCHVVVDGRAFARSSSTSSRTPSSTPRRQGRSAIDGRSTRASSGSA